MFIIGSKFKKIKDAAQNGDDRAKEILRLQFRGDDDEKLNDLIESFFTEDKPVVEEPQIEVVDNEVEESPHEEHHEEHHSRAEKLKKFLDDNGVGENDVDYEDWVKDFNNEFPEEDDDDDEPCCDVDLGSDESDESEVHDGEGPYEMIEFLIEDEVEAIKGYDKAILLFSQLEINDSTKKGILAQLQEIKEEEIHHIEELKKLKIK